MMSLIFTLLGIICILLAILDLRSEHSSGAIIFFLSMTPLLFLLGIVDLSNLDYPEVSRRKVPLIFYSFLVGEIVLATIFLYVAFQHSALVLSV